METWEWKRHFILCLSFSGSHDQLVTSLHRCTSLVIQSSPPSPSPPPSTPPPLSPLSRSLLSAIVQLPVRAFTEVAIATAIGCWQWLLTAVPILEFSVSHVLLLFTNL